MTINQSSHSQSNIFSRMAVKMVLFWVSLVLSVIGSNALGELSILHSPDSLKFVGNDEILESHLKELYSASLGLSVEEKSDWDGLAVVDPFNVPEAIVQVNIEGVSSIGNFPNIKNVHKYKLAVDNYQPETFSEMKHRIIQRFSNGGNNLVDINLSDPNQLTKYSHVFGEIAIPKVPKSTYKHLKHNVEEDYQFLSELENLKTLTAALKTSGIYGDNVIDFYNLKFRSLHPLSDYHGPSSLQAKEAKALLAEALTDLSEAFKKAYYNSVLFTIVTTDATHLRRSIRAAPTEQQRISSTQDKHEKANFKIVDQNRRQFDSSDESLEYEMRQIFKRMKTPRNIPSPSVSHTTHPWNTKLKQATITQPITKNPQATISERQAEADTTEPSSDEPSTEEPTTAEDTTTTAPEKKDVTGDAYSGDYAAIFNIILWFSVVFIFALVAITYAVIDMDPGRDSIIYRMTSTRIKKDN